MMSSSFGLVGIMLGNGQQDGDGHGNADTRPTKLKLHTHKVRAWEFYETACVAVFHVLAA